MKPTIIDLIVSEHKELINYLEEKEEISLKNNVDRKFTKTLVLSIASFFEKEICDALIQLVKSQSNSEKLASFVQKKAISRQYHTYFSWKDNNANQFLALFGPDFKEKISEEMKSEESLKEGCKAFLTLGRKRNELVHQNFADFNIEWTINEILDEYKKAVKFVIYLIDQIS